MEIFTYGEAPYKGMSNTETLAAVSSGYRMPKPTNSVLSDSTYGLMLKCWSAKPEDRPTLAFIADYIENSVTYSEPTHLMIDESVYMCL